MIVLPYSWLLCTSMGSSDLLKTFILSNSSTMPSQRPAEAVLPPREAKSDDDDDSDDSDDSLSGPVSVHPGSKRASRLVLNPPPTGFPFKAGYVPPPPALTVPAPPPPPAEPEKKQSIAERYGFKAPAKSKDAPAAPARSRLFLMEAKGSGSGKGRLRIQRTVSSPAAAQQAAALTKRESDLAFVVQRAEGGAMEERADDGPEAARPTSPQQQSPSDKGSPFDWVAVYSQQYKRDYFYNQRTGESVWEDPTAPVPTPGKAVIHGAKSAKPRRGWGFGGL